MNTPTTPSRIRPLRKHTIESTSTTETATAVPATDAGSSSPNGVVPTTISAANATTMTTASNDRRPSWLQYTSSRRTHSANSSMVKPAPTPNAIAVRFHHGDASGTANPRKPASIIRQMPQTRWWTCTPLPVSTPPGHHETLRVSRALVRIDRNDTTNAASTRNAVPVPGAARAPKGSTSRIVAMGGMGRSGA